MNIKHSEKFIEYWRRAFCPYCDARNWIYDSHSMRPYPDIPDLCECFNCQGMFSLNDPAETSLREGTEIECKGLENPN